MIREHEADHASYWRVMDSRRLPRRLRYSKPISYVPTILKPSKFVCGKRITQIIMDMV